VDEKAFQSIKEINKKIKDHPFKLAVIDINETELLEKNARYMPAEMFQNLVQNIRKDKGLSSVPFCYKEGTRFKVLSGNHRVKAAKEAGIKTILVMYTDQHLTREEQVSIQLSHNAIEGKDDPAILKELWNEIQDIDLKLYAGLDDKTLAELEKITLDPLAEVQLDYRTLSFVFLPDEAERLEKAFKTALAAVADNEIYLAHISNFSRLLDSLSKCKDSYEIKNSATSLMVVLDIFENHLTDLSKGWEGRQVSNKDWVPLASVIGTDKIPAESAKIIKQAVNKMKKNDQVAPKNLWQTLEYWAADYLAGE